MHVAPDSRRFVSERSLKAFLHLVHRLVTGPVRISTDNLAPQSMQQARDLASALREWIAFLEMICNSERRASAHWPHRCGQFLAPGFWDKAALQSRHDLSMPPKSATCQIARPTPKALLSLAP
jgi:hypothetical protein